MSRLRTIAVHGMALAGLAAMPAAAAAQSAQAATTSGAQPLELQLLDQNLQPITGAIVSVNGTSTQPTVAGRYGMLVQGPKVVIRVDLATKGVQPTVLELPLQQGKLVYVEVCLDPETGAIKNVFQKATRADASGSDKPVRIGPGQATGVFAQSAGTPPLNDDCANALPIAEGVTAFSTLGASTDGPDHPGTCQFGNGETVNDIWYVYTASASGTLTVSTCDNVDYDSDLVVYDGTDCSSLLANLLGCNDDGTGCAGFSSELQVPVVGGNEYLIRVGGYGSFGDESAGSGNLTLTLDAAGGAPANDDCANAEELPCNGTVTFDNTFATTDPSDPAFSCHFGGAAQGEGTVWYTFTATHASAFLSTNPSAGGDSLLAVYDGSCGGFTELACSEDEGVGLLSELELTGLSVGATYYVQVASFNAGALGEYTLELVCPAPGDPTGRCCLPDGSCFEGVTEDECFTTLAGNDWLEGATCASDPCPQPLPNDDCEDAIALGPLPATVIVDNTGATTDILPGSECGVASGPFHNVWYSFVGNGAMVRVTTCQPGTINPDTKVSVFCADCGDPVCVGGNDDAPSCPLGQFSSTLDFCTVLGTTYYVTVGDFSATSGSGPIQLRVLSNGVACTGAVQCEPKGACCLPDRCINANLTECNNSGGVFQGDGTRCRRNSVVDGSFEAGAGAGTWTEFSSTFGTPLCTEGSCGTGGGSGAFDGDWWAWFGGISGIVESGFVEQTAVIPMVVDELTFWLDIPASSGNAQDFMNVTIDGNVVFTVLEGDPTYTVPGWQQVSVDVSAYNDGMPHAIRFESTTFGTGVTNFFVDDVEIAFGVVCDCQNVVVLDFETEDDGVTPLVNGQDVSTPPEFGTYVSISASTISQGPAIFDSDPNGPNLATNADPDLLVDKGNVLMFQENPGQTVPGIFDVPDDSSAGGTFFFDFNMPVEVRSLVVADIDLYPPPQDVYIVLIDSAFNTRTIHLPSGFTEDRTIDGGTGYRTVDLTTLAPQAGFASVSDAVEDPGFVADDVVRMEVTLTSSGAIDDIEFCF